MWCSTTATSTVQGPAARRHSAAAPAPSARVGDDDRQRTADLLVRATGTGHLDLEQLDARIARVWAARTGADLAELEADLPSLRAERDRREVAERRRADARSGLGAHVAAYAAVMALLVAVWLVGALTSGAWYPWPLWPALGWGIAVAGQARAALTPVR